MIAEAKRPLDPVAILKAVRASGNLIIKIALGVGLVIALAALFPRGESVQMEYKIGGIWAQKDLIAPFAFPIFRDDREYARDVDAAKQKVFMVFDRDTTIAGRQAARVGTFFQRMKDATAAYHKYQKSLRNRGETAREDSLTLAAHLAAIDIPVGARDWPLLDRLDASGEFPRMQRFLEETLRAMYATGVIDRSKGTISPPDIALRSNKLETILPAARVLDHTDVASFLESRLLSHYRADNDTVALAYRVGIVFAVPNIRFNAAATEQAIAAAVDAITRTTGYVQENERVVSKHERITPEIRLKLESYRRVKMERGPASDTMVQFAGTLLHVAIVLVPLVIYLFLFRRRIFGNNRRLALIALLFLLVACVAYLSRELDVNAPIEYLIFVPAASMLLTIIFDSRVGFYGTIVLAFIVAGVRGNDYSLAVASVVAGALSVYSVRDMKHRTQLFRSLGLIFLGYTLAIVALGMERYEPAPVILEQILFALVNAIVSPVLTYGLLIFLERVFRVTTDLTLMELAQFNHPLLRMLAEKAPGTYHHSMTLASLAETAAAAIGANEVLVRVGAYFHDVGKIVKPTYFVENQKGNRNRHDKLSPRMSSLIIGAHVKDGIALARDYNLPEEVVDFIPMHHGTTRMDYFFNKAVQLAKNSDDETKIDEIIETDYRYPGPKPQTRETGIMMLADAIEAAVRTIEEPTPQRLGDAIDELIRKRFEEGELDECPLTMKELTKIKAAFLGVLVGIYHSRVKYPEAPPKPARPRRLRLPKPEPEIPAEQPPPQEEPPASGDTPAPDSTPP